MEARSADTEVERGTPEIERQVVAPRGGVSMLAIVTGAFIGLVGAGLLATLVASLLRYSGYTPSLLLSEAGGRATMIAGAIVVIIPFLSLFWGGYTAARMGRGRGAAHGLLVWLVAGVIAAVAFYGYQALFAFPGRFDLIFEESRFPSYVALAGIVASALGSLVGGVMGARWHRRLEWKAFNGRGAPASSDSAVEASR